MYDPLTYIYPRTMQQAFGPYTDNTLYIPEEETKMDKADKIVVIACALASVAVVVLFAVENLK